MKVNCRELLTGFVICAVFSLEKCLCQVIINSTPINVVIPNNTLYTTTCTLPEETEAYCVSIFRCPILIKFLNQTALRARRCGTHGEDRTNPFVCCEKYYVRLDQKVTAPQPTQPVISVQEELTTVLPPSTTWMRPPQQNQVPPPRPPDQNLSFPTDQGPVVFTSPPLTSTSLPPPTLPKTEEVNDQRPFRGCGVQDISSRILGGEPASQKEFPWLARLLRRDDQGEVTFSCTGALITSKVVLTTAHCLVSDQLRKIGDIYAVSLGEHETECISGASECLLNKKTVMISKVIVHPHYDMTSKNHDHDIGLVILNKNVSYSSYVSPICLLESKIDTPRYFVSGWGKTENGLNSGVKLKTELPFFNWEQCVKKYRTINIELTDRQICAGGVGGKDSCQGDSGGPLMFYNDMKWYVVGVVSFGLGCGKQGWPAVYVYVPSYINWIKAHVKHNSR